MEYVPLPPEQQNYMVKDGMMTALSALVKIMLDSKDYCQYVLPILVFHIIPEFDGSIAVNLFFSIQFEVI